MTVHLKKILVPLDGSPLAETAIPYARCLLEGRPGEICLLLTPPVYQATWNEVDREVHYSDECAKYLPQTAAALSSDLPQAHVHWLFAHGNPAEQILAYAEEQGCDLIVMASHGRTHLERWVYGSVADPVARRAVCPVMIVGGRVAH